MPYEPFCGATLTDTFQITEEGDRVDTSLIPVNNDRITAQLAVPIKVIVANPPILSRPGLRQRRQRQPALPDSRCPDCRHLRGSLISNQQEQPVRLVHPRLPLGHRPSR